MNLLLLTLFCTITLHTNCADTPSIRELVQQSYQHNVTPLEWIALLITRGTYHDSSDIAQDFVEKFRILSESLDRPTRIKQNLTVINQIRFPAIRYNLDYIRELSTNKIAHEIYTALPNTLNITQNALNECACEQLGKECPICLEAFIDTAPLHVNLCCNMVLCLACRKKCSSCPGCQKSLPTFPDFT